MFKSNIIFGLFCLIFAGLFLSCTEKGDDPIYYTVGFNSQGGEEIAPITKEKGAEITLPTPVRGGYTFNGWYSAALGGSKYLSPYTLTGSVTMYAQWTAITPNTNSYTLTFDTQGGTSVSPMSGTSGTSVTLPTPTRSGYTFNGWYNAASGGTKYLSPYTLAGNVTMYAQWTAVGGGNDTESGKDTTIAGIACVLVKAGTFMMGGGDDVHQVTLTQDYWISKYPVTQAQYQAVTDSNPSRFSGSNNPVERVNWTEANNFAQSVGGRLPTEAEWEFAARGGNKSQGYIYSGSNNLDNVAWYGNNNPYGTKPAGQKQPNELGIYDMSGNVFEWCNDWYGSYPENAVTNPTGPDTGDNRVFRGGDWYHNAQYCRVEYRGDGLPSYKHYYNGFRVAFPRN